MIKDLSGDQNTLTKWIGAVDADLPQLRSFTAGLRRDLDAVVAGLTLDHNSGAVEGTVYRIKQLKAAHVRTRETRPPPKADTPGLNTARSAARCVDLGMQHQRPVGVVGAERSQSPARNRRDPSRHRNPRLQGLPPWGCR